MMETLFGNVAKRPTENDDTWRSRILQAQDFAGTDVEYCQHHGINLGHFKAYKKKLGLTRWRRRRTKAFARVVTNDIPHRLTRDIERPLLRTRPDPRWVAEFVSILLAQK